MAQSNFSSRATTMQIEAAAHSDRGRVRPQNEDAIALCEPSDERANLGWLYLLADGAGGHAAGEVASRLAIETISKVYYQRTPPLGIMSDNAQFSNEASSPLTRLQHAFFAAHLRIQELADQQRECRNMATTCIAAAIKDGRFVIAHVGDSRAYLIQTTPSSSPIMTRLTTDHSMAVAMMQAGILSPEQAQSAPSRHMLLRMLGGSQENVPLPDFRMQEIHPGEYLVLCCDGLWSKLSEERMAQVACTLPPQAACTELVRLANEAGGEDNISVIVLAFR
ncbi:MAG TPA: protein phosphatase 2C domain-containing protein [Ktedonobacteraceae bacterium]|jgi:serine/threonine protein phosphatase PrpC|nr:protein phosphatase 2C domain-containing protein [Ktedonobacteraceae bacterium]